MTQAAMRLAFEEASGTASREIHIGLFSGEKKLASIFFRSNGIPLDRPAAALLCLGLVPAIEVGADLAVEGDVDAALLGNAPAIQKLICGWYPDRRPVEISARRGQTNYAAGRGEGLFFSGGVDSCYSLAVARDRLDGLITILGADVPLSDLSECSRLAALAVRVAQAYGMESTIIETNVREVFRPYIGWTEYHGSALAAVRHLLGQRFENVLIASSGDETGWDCPWGSHPALDPLFGTVGARIEHHGLNHRLAKIERILSEPELMRELKICNKESYNCGVCGKCTLAMRCLEVLDGFDRAPTFPPAETRAGKFEIVDDATRSDLAHLRMAALQAGRNDIAGEIDAALRPYDRRKALRRFAPVPDLGSRLKRAKRQFRYWRASP